MAVFCCEDNQLQYWPMWPLDDTSGDSGVTWNWNIYTSMTCPHCQGWIHGTHVFTFCPYCGKELFPIKDIKPDVLERLDKMLKEIEDIKKELMK